MKKSLLLGIIISLFIGNCNTSHAQTDTEFWFVKPNITVEHTNGSFKFVFTTREFDANVTIEMPAEPAFTPVSITIPAYTSSEYVVIEPSEEFYLMENTTIIEQLYMLPPENRNNIGNKAILVKSNAPITAYLTQIHNNNSDIYSFKGSNGIGTEFIIPFQEHGFNQSDNYDERAFSSIEIIGIEDETVVEITPPAGKSVYRSGLYPNETNPYTITLNRGEVYTCAPGWDPTVTRGNVPNSGWWGVNGDKHLGGIIVNVLSGSGVAVVKKDDSVRFGTDDGSSTGGWDIIADQWVPYKDSNGNESNLVGTEYAILRGGLNDGWEYVYAAAPENNTKIWWGNSIDTTISPTSAILNKGEQVAIQFDNAVFTNNILEITSNKPMSILHVSGYGTEMGGAVIPPINKCSGSTSVSFSRDMVWSLYINLIVRNGAENDFLVDGIVRNDIIDPASFVPVGLSGEWLATQIYYADNDLSDFPVGVVRTISNSEDVFHLGLINGNSNGGCRYGYYSDFNEIKIGALFIDDDHSPSSTIRACIGQNVQLYASGGTNYNWWPSTNLSSTNTSHPTAIIDEFRTYLVEVFGACNYKDTAAITIEPIEVPTANFTVNTNSGTSPLTVDISNIDSAYNYNWYWDDNDFTTPDYETETNLSFTHTYSNSSNTVETKNLTLIVENEFACSDTLKKTITIYPNNEFYAIDSLWFAVPYITDIHGDPFANITITATDSINITNIKISQAFIPNIEPIYLSIDPSDSIIKDIYFSRQDLFKIMNNFWVRDSYDPNPYITNSSIVIESDRKIDAFVEYQRNSLNQEIFTLKGKDALGYDFWVPFQNTWNNHDYDFEPALSQIVLTATSPNTEINITFQNDAYGLPAGTYTYNLAEPGMTMMFVPKANADDFNEPSFLASDRLAGTHITSNKPISVTIADDSVQKGGWDLIGDQLVPVKNFKGEATIGKEYIVLKGKVDDINGNEKVYILTTEDNTNISYTIKGKATISNLVTNSGSQFEIDLIQATSDDYVYIVADKPVYTFHVSGFGSELAGAIIPAIDGCRGNFEVNFVRSNTQDYCLNILTHQNAIDSFEISIAGNPYTPFLSSSDFESVGVGDCYILKTTSNLQNSLPIMKSIRLRNSANVFHLGSINGVAAGGGSVYGYFSNYSENRGAAFLVTGGSDILTNCFGEEVQFKASGGTSYSWTPITYLDNPTSPEPKATLPVGIHNYQVQVSRECYADTILNVSVEVYENSDALFNVNTTSGCSPLEIEFENLSTEADTFLIDWGNDGIFDTFLDNSMSQTLLHSYINTTNHDTVYTILLKAWHKQRECYDTYEKQIIVHPQVSASFSIDQNKGCSPLNINFTNNSIGEDSVLISYGDGTIEVFNSLTSINHIYKNTGTNVDTNLIEFVVYNSFGCTNTLRDTVIVYPEVKANYAIDGNNYEGCNSRTIIFTNTSEDGIHTASRYLWEFDDGTNIDTTNNTINKFYNNTTTDDIIYNFRLTARSIYACTDDTTNTLSIYKALADFEVNVDQGCSPLEISITNKSVGAQISSWDWDFDDGTITTVQNPFSKLYTNTSGDPIIQNMQLSVTGTNGCSTSKTVPVTVYSSINAQFTLDFYEGCNPLSVNFTNTTINANSYYWNFGDGDTSIYEHVNHLYTNTTNTDKVYILNLRAESQYGCNHDTSAIVTVYSNIVADFTIDSKEGCSPLNATILNTSIGNSTDSYQWLIDNVPMAESPTYNSNFMYTFDNSGSSIHNYEIKLIATNQYGCTSEKTDIISVYPELVTEIIDSSNVSCNGTVDGFISVSVLSGIPPYNYMWSTGETNPTITGIDGGIYTLTVSDANACSSINTIIINEPPQTSINIESTDVSCYGLHNGTLAVTPNSGITSFLWSTGTTDSIISNLSPGLYAVTVTNNDGCVSTGSYNILEPDSISIITDLYTESICPSQYGQIDISVYGGNPPYNYMWSSGEITQDIYNLDAGNYNISVIDINACFSSKNYIIDSVTSFNDEEICYVSINPELEMNEIVWDRTPDQGIEYYKVYRHNPNANVYENVALLPFSDGGYFIDSLANIQNEAIKYKISSINKCATESSLSGFHKSLYLNITNASEMVMLEWEAYEVESGNPNIIGYIIYRGSDPTSLNPIDTISSNESNYLDNNPESLINEFYYRIVGIKSSACILSTNNEFNLIFSNLVKNNINTGIEIFSDQSINLNIFPNPFNDEVTIEYELYSKSNITIEVYDIIGKKITTLKKNKEDIGFHSHLFNPKDYGYSSGIYYIKLIIDNHTISKKIIQIN